MRAAAAPSSAAHSSAPLPLRLHHQGVAHTVLLYEDLPVPEFKALVATVFALPPSICLAGLKEKKPTKEQEDGRPESRRGRGQEEEEEDAEQQDVIVPLSLACRYPHQLQHQEYELILLPATIPLSRPPTLPPALPPRPPVSSTFPSASATTTSSMRRRPASSPSLPPSFLAPRLSVPPSDQLSPSTSLSSSHSSSSSSSRPSSSSSVSPKELLNGGSGENAMRREQGEEEEEEEEGEEGEKEKKDEVVVVEAEKEGAAVITVLCTTTAAAAAAAAAEADGEVEEEAASTREEEEEEEEADADPEGKEEEGRRDESSRPSPPPSLHSQGLQPEPEAEGSEDNESNRHPRDPSPSLPPSLPSIHHLLLPSVPPPYIPSPRPASPPPSPATDNEEGMEEGEEGASWEALGELLDFMIKATLLLPPDFPLLRRFLSSSPSARRFLLSSYRSFLSHTIKLDALVVVICKLVKQARMEEGRKGGKGGVSVATQTSAGRRKMGSGSSSSSSSGSSTRRLDKPRFNLLRSSPASSLAPPNPSLPIANSGFTRDPPLHKTSLPPSSSSSSSFLSLLSSLHLTPVQIRALRRAILKEDKGIMACLKKYQESQDLEKLKEGLREAVRVVVLEEGERKRE